MVETDLHRGEVDLIVVSIDGLPCYYFLGGIHSWRKQRRREESHH